MTTTNKIPEVIDEQLQFLGLGAYAQQAQPVKDALVEREQEIAYALLEAGAEQGLEPADLIRTFEGLGMHLPELENEDNVPVEAPTDQSLTDTINALLAFARRNGFEG